MRFKRQQYPALASQSQASCFKANIFSWNIKLQQPEQFLHIHPIKLLPAVLDFEIIFLQTFSISTRKSLMMVHPTTCCKKTAGDCTCAAQAKCSCGEKEALNCSCEKADQENSLSGPRCSCRQYLFSQDYLPTLDMNHLLMEYLGMRPAKECNCERSTEENVVSGETCDCGLRKSDQCNPSPREGCYFSWGFRM